MQGSIVHPEQRRNLRMAKGYEEEEMSRLEETSLADFKVRAASDEDKSGLASELLRFAGAGDRSAPCLEEVQVLIKDIGLEAMDALIDALSSGSRELRALARDCLLELGAVHEEKVLSALWSFIKKSTLIGPVDLAMNAILRITRDPNHVLDMLIDDKQVRDWQKGSVMVWHSDLVQAMQSRWDDDSGRFLPLIFTALEHRYWRVTYSAVYWLADKPETILIPPEPRQRAARALMSILRSGPPDKAETGYFLKAFAALERMGGEAAIVEVIKDPGEQSQALGAVLLEQADFLKKHWAVAEDRESILRLVLEALKDARRSIRLQGTEWLSENLEDLPGDSLPRVTRAMEERLRDDEDPDVRTSADQLLVQLRERERKRGQRVSNWLTIIEEGDEDTQAQAIRSLVEMKTREALRRLIDKWVQWIAVGHNSFLVETTAEAMRASPLAILPLVAQFSSPFQPDLGTKSLLRSGAKQHIMSQPQREAELSERTLTHQPLEQEALARQILEETGESPGRLSPEDKREASATQSPEETGEPAGGPSPEDKGKASATQSLEETGEPAGELSPEDRREALVWLDSQLRLMELAVRRRIVQLMSDMSNPRFFDEGSEEYDAVKHELSRHAVPVLARQLPTEQNFEIREHMTYILGNVGGPTAVDGLARAVVGEELQRSQRQGLLREYYLEPSMKRSEEVAAILNTAVVEAKRTLRILQQLNIAVFAIGAVFLIVGLGMIVVSEEASGRWAGAVTSLGGFAGIMAQLIRAPLDRIQNAMANLVQIETAFTGFIWELNLNGTYIQSQYVAEGILRDDDIAQTVGRIEDAMSLAMNMVTAYTKEGSQRIVTRIHSLFPAAGEVGTKITIHGQHLTGEANPKGGHTGLIAINHSPVHAEDISWRQHEVSFRLPSEIPGLGSGEGTAWVSLFVDGMETNALPYHVVASRAAT
jgi:hypothetical protein